jgi:hypothetical protein
VSYGYFGSELNDELNRLANGGTYPPRQDYVDWALATRNWAAAREVTITETDTVGVLNEIAGKTSRSEYLDLSGICNYLAGTTWLPAAAALREIAS